MYWASIFAVQVPAIRVDKDAGVVISCVSRHISTYLIVLQRRALLVTPRFTASDTDSNGSKVPFGKADLHCGTCTLYILTRFKSLSIGFYVLAAMELASMFLNPLLVIFF